MSKLKMHSPNITELNIAKLAELFPGCVTESHDAKGRLKKSIDFDLLRQELSDHIVEGPQERYQLNWPGKREALLTANAPIAKTLRPCREESVDFDTTQNLFIEGDNLDALKLLQETYLNQVKLIYIDPPYNTGKDSFIYEDDFSEDVETYKLRSNEVSEQGIRLVVNSERNGRFHSDWLSMMYPRLKLARNLLAEDGAVFISIDDGEVANLKKMCDGLFGEKNFIANVVWQKKYSPQNDATYFSDMHDHILVYAKQAKATKNDLNGWNLDLLPRTAQQNAAYQNPDNDPRGPWKSSDFSVKTYSEHNDYPITNPAGRVIYPPESRCWVVSKERYQHLLEDNRIWFGVDGTNVPSLKRFLTEVQDGRVPVTWWTYQECGHNQDAKKELKALMHDVDVVFDTPKPLKLISQMIWLATKSDPNAIVMDFFAGSGSTAHAVMDFNVEYGGKRKFICVQIPEAIESKDFSTIAELTKERIRRAGKKIKEDYAGKEGIENLDIGFRVLKVDSSNMKDVYYAPDELVQGDLLTLADNIREDRTAEDLLFQVLLDWGVDLALPIEEKNIAGKRVFFVDGNALVACFDKGIDEDFVEQLAVYAPLRAVFRDSGFAKDNVKINVEQIFKALSPVTDVKTI